MSDGVKRYIRLKEFGANVERKLEPSPEYIALTNGSLRPGPKDLRTDQNGFIAGPASKGPDIEAVAVLGDSFVECSFLEEGARLTDRMSDLGNALNRGMFLNGGYSGSTSLNLLTLAIAKLPTVASGIVLIVPSNDGLALDNAAGYWALQDKRYSPIVPYERGPLARGKFSENIWQLGVVLRTFEAFCRASNIKLTFGTFPHIRSNFEEFAWWKKRYPVAGSYEEVIGRRLRLNEEVRKCSTQLRVPLLDLELLCQPDHMYDDLHLNADGAAWLAEKIVNQI